MFNSSKDISPQDRVDILKSFFAQFKNDRHPLMMLFGHIMDGNLDIVKKSLSDKDSENKQLKTRIDQLNEALGKRELNQSGSNVDEIPFGAVEQDHEKAALQRQVDELQLLLESKVDELEKYKSAVSKVITQIELLTPASIEKGQDTGAGWHCCGRHIK
ncbi:hypothetical protein ACTWOG_000957 [Serratia marcescens]